MVVNTPIIFGYFLSDNLTVFSTARADTVINLGESHVATATVRSEVDGNDVFHGSFPFLLC
jgi:hypothetical protein